MTDHRGHWLNHLADCVRFDHQPHRAHLEGHLGNLIPDALINQTIGEGGRIYTSQPNFVEVPSFRQNQIELRDALADALATAVPIPEDPP